MLRIIDSILYVLAIVFKACRPLRVFHLTSDFYRTWFWNHVSKSFLSELFDIAEYPNHLKQRYLQFFSSYVIPKLGPTPSQLGPMRPIIWMTDDCTPVEYSLSNEENGAILVRFTVEPLNAIDGWPTPSASWIPDLQALANSGMVDKYDPAWPSTCFRHLVYPDKFDFQATGCSHQSQFTIGADFGRNGLILKAYFIPHIRTALEGVQKADLVTACLAELGVLDAWLPVKTFIDANPTLDLELEIVAVDGRSPQSNRAKVYLGTSARTLCEILQIFTLGGRISGEGTRQAIIAIEAMWKHFFPGTTATSRIESSHPSHYASRFLFYFELRLGDPTPSPKFYCPVRHFCPDDQWISEKFVSWCYELGLPTFANMYRSHIKTLCSHRPLSSGTGVQTYVCVSPGKKVPKMTLYLNPEAFSSKRG